MEFTEEEAWVIQKEETFFSGLFAELTRICGIEEAKNVIL